MLAAGAAQRWWGKVGATESSVPEAVQMRQGLHTALHRRRLLPSLLQRLLQAPNTGGAANGTMPQGEFCISPASHPHLVTSTSVKGVYVRLPMLCNLKVRSYAMMQVSWSNWKSSYQL